MPKNLIDYSNTIIYKICCKNINVKDVYVGHTTNFVKRKNQHKMNCTNPNNSQYNFLPYKIIRDNGGWDNWEMLQIEKVCCKDSAEARLKEQECYQALKAKLNNEKSQDDGTIFCSVCNKNYSIKEYKIHLTGKTHKALEINGINLSPENPQKYTCELCNYSTSNKKDINKHLLTSKHQKRENGIKMEVMEMSKIPEFVCACSKDFATQSGLWKHKQKCEYNNKELIEIKNTSYDIKNTDSDVKILTNMVLEVVKQNQELISQNSETQKQNQELTNKLYEICKNGTNNTLINNNSHNKTFNLQFFLNETCKDAMNIMDFVDSIKLQLTDLEKVGEVGYVEGISNIIVNNLKELDVTLRPIHCTDKKREVLYIKDENKWEKEDDEKKKLRKVIKRVAHKNARLLQTYKEQHPDCSKSNSIYSDQYNKIIIEAMGGLGNNDLEKENKIIKNITSVTTIDKGYK